MRGTRWLLVLAILAILAGIGVTFRFQQERLQKDAPVKPALLPTELSGVRSNFTWVRKDEGRTVAEVSARTPPVTGLSAGLLSSQPSKRTVSSAG